MTSFASPDIRTARRLDPAHVAEARVVLCDLDGCLMSEGRLFDDTKAFIDACGERLWVLSNDSTHTAEELSAKLAACGVTVPQERLFLAGSHTLQTIVRLHPDKSIAIYASPAIQLQAERMGLRLDMESPDIVLLCRDPGFSLSRLVQLTEQVSQGATLWVSNTDHAHPGRNGRPVAETGALLAAVQAVLGDIPVTCFGKPHASMAQAALAMTGLSVKEAIFVGDNAATDGAMARSLGIPFVHIVRESVQ